LTPERFSDIVRRAKKLLTTIGFQAIYELPEDEATPELIAAIFDNDLDWISELILEEKLELQSVPPRLHSLEVYIELLKSGKCDSSKLENLNQELAETAVNLSLFL
jgi:hypothetical protein